MIPLATGDLTGWGNCFPESCQIARPESVNGLDRAFQIDGIPDVIPRGLGRSYGDPAQNGGGGVIDCTRLNRMIGFDPETGVLEAEAGVSLADILEAIVRRGWFLSVTPGTKFVTIGGAIANDIHGKNHHVDGSFSDFLLDFQLLTPGGDLLTCSREEHADVFWATVGGVGLTGLIVSARIRLQPIETAWCKVDYRRCANVHDLLAAIQETDQDYKYSVAWVDCLGKGNSLGRSVLMSGDHAPRGDLPGSVRDPLVPPRKLGKTVPVNLPSFTLNRLSVKAFNEVFYRTHPSSQGRLVVYDTYFYPLDAIHHWNRIYGKAGFTQYQVTVPVDRSDGLVTILERLSAHGGASFLAVLKRMGNGNEGLLTYPMNGYTLTLDIPMRKSLVPFLHELDEILLDHGGRLYLAKDVCTRPETFAAMYPKLDAFRHIKERLDPENKLSSRMARRLGLAPERTT